MDCSALLHPSNRAFNFPTHGLASKDNCSFAEDSHKTCLCRHFLWLQLYTVQQWQNVTDLQNSFGVKFYPALTKSAYLLWYSFFKMRYALKLECYNTQTTGILYIYRM